MVPDPSLIINDVIMTSLLLLNIIYVLANFFVLSDTSLFEYFSLQGKKIDGSWILPKNSTNDFIMTSNYVIVQTKL